jgi:hypothetical protein
LASWTITLSLNTGQVATVTAMISYQDSDLNPSGCFAVGHLLVG